MQKTFNHTVPENYKKNERITEYAIGLFPVLLTKNAVKKAIKKQLLRIDNKLCKTSDFVDAGQQIELEVQDTTKRKVFQLKLDILFEDNYLAVVHKPAGYPVSGNAFKTLENALAFNLKPSNHEDALPYPLPVHRLDNQTSGLIIVAKTNHSRINLGQQFENKHISKTYFAVVIGKTPKKGDVNLPVDGKKSYTEYELIKTTPSLRNGYLSLLKLSPHTGRTHQLRIHCEASGFPILGDKLYFGKHDVYKGKGLFLAACELSFLHPLTNEDIQISIPYPKKFSVLMEREQKRFDMNKKL